MIEKINAIVDRPFQDANELLSFYQVVLPGRIHDFRLDEVGPIMSVGSEEEVAGYLENKFYFNGVGMDMGDNIDCMAHQTATLNGTAALCAMVTLCTSQIFTPKQAMKNTQRQSSTRWWIISKKCPLTTQKGSYT